MKNINGKDINYFIEETIVSGKDAVQIFNDCAYKRGVTQIENYKPIVKMIALYQKNKNFAEYIAKEKKK